MTDPLRNFVNGLEPWIRAYSYALAGFFLFGVLVLLIVSVVAKRRLTVAAQRLTVLPSLSATAAVDGASEATYNEMLSIVDALPDKGVAWWVAVHPTIEGYSRKGPAKAKRVGYFVTERLDESIAAASRNDGWFS